MIRLLLSVALTAIAVTAGVVVSGPDPGDVAADRRTSPTSSPSASSSPESPEPPPEPATPRVRACYRLTFTQALAPVTRKPAASCTASHTARTVHVGRLSALVDGRRGPVDAPRVQSAVAADCPQRVGTFLGGPEQALRLSMFRPIWFTPTLAQEERGAEWYRCDVIALAGAETLLPLEGRLEGLLGRLGWKDRYGLCATAEPGTPAFERVSCARQHSWRALSTVAIPGARYPGVDAVVALGTEPCTEAGLQVAADPLDFQWGYEWPTLEQWRTGRRYGVCWAPEA